MKRVHIIASGKVQGVSYRDFVRMQAEKFGVVGFVRNIQDGNVEIVGESADHEKLNLFVRECKRGSLLAFVKNADVRLEPATGEFEDFLIRHS